MHGRPISLPRLAPTGTGASQSEITLRALATVPASASTVPGDPTPTPSSADGSTPAALAAAVIASASARMTPFSPASLGVGHAVLAEHLGAAVHDDRLDLRPSEIDASAHVSYLPRCVSGDVTLPRVRGGGAGRRCWNVFGAMWSGISPTWRSGTKERRDHRGVDVLIFPLYFASTAFVPYDLLPSWLQTLNKVNPVSYLVEGMRTLMLEGWQWQPIGEAFLAAAAVAASRSRLGGAAHGAGVELDDLVRRHRRAEEETLAEHAAVGGQEAALALGLDAFGQRLEAEVAGELDDALDDRDRVGPRDGTRRRTSGRS